MLWSDISVVEIEGTLAGGFSAKALADLGARVTRIERAPGDRLRDLSGGGLYGYLHAQKSCVAVDLESRGGRDYAIAALREADLIVLSSGAGVPTLGALTPTDLTSLEGNPSVLALTPYGLSGQYSRHRGSDLTVAHRAGLAWAQGRPVSNPAIQPPVGLADLEGPLSFGLAASVAGLAAVMSARMIGQGAVIDFAEADYLSHLLIQDAVDYSDGHTRFSRRQESPQGTEIAGGLIWILRCKDGWVVVSPREAHQWDRWVELLGNPPWSKDASIVGDKEARRLNWDQLGDLMTQWTARLSKDEVTSRAQAARVAAFPLSTARDLLQNAQLAQRHFFDDLELEAGKHVRVPGLPFSVETSDGVSVSRGRHLRVPPLHHVLDDTVRPTWLGTLL
jgi:crotonobetainyl-CoA:carnitine CoA-transferase CaiB-like acyl-CoA transferase